MKVEEKTNLGLSDPRDRDIASMSIAAALAAHDKYNGSYGGRLHVWMAAGTPRGTDEAVHKAIGDACANHNIGLTMHCAEAPEDLVIYQDVYNCSPAEFCQRTNLMGPGRHTVLAHMVNLDSDRDMPLLSADVAGVTIAHNASSNCKLASGIAPVPDMLQNNVNVSLGTDGAPCANTYDMIQEMRVAALVHRGVRHDATAITAEQVLAMATIHGARALGLETEVGSLEVGKKADLVVIDTSGLHCAPFDPQQVVDGGIDPITTVVFSCSGADVETVVVDGQILVSDRKLVRYDETAIIAAAQHAIQRIRTSSRTAHGGHQRNYC